MKFINDTVKVISSDFNGAIGKIVEDHGRDWYLVDFGNKIKLDFHDKKLTNCLKKTTCVTLAKPFKSTS